MSCLRISRTTRKVRTWNVFGGSLGVVVVVTTNDTLSDASILRVVQDHGTTDNGKLAVQRQQVVGERVRSCAVVVRHQSHGVRHPASVALIGRRRRWAANAVAQTQVATHG